MDNQRNDVIALAVLSFLGGVIVTIGVLRANNQHNPCEYQFTVTDNIVEITDYDRQVGIIELDGNLKQLIDMDNE
jgi:hypothetical protein